MYHQMEGFLRIIKVYTFAVYFVNAFILLCVMFDYSYTSQSTDDKDKIIFI
jgi:hypothetical protein